MHAHLINPMNNMEVQNCHIGPQNQPGEPLQSNSNSGYNLCEFETSTTEAAIISQLSFQIF